MHIAFLTNEYPPLPSGGIGTSVRNLGRALTLKGHQVTVIGWGKKMAFADAGIMVCFLEHTSVLKLGWFLNRWQIQRELTRMVLKDQLDIVEAPDWCGLSAGMRLDCPLVIRCHGSATYFANLLRESVRSSVRLAERWALQEADAVAAVSTFTANETRRVFQLKSKITTIPNGIDIAQFHPGTPDDVEPNTILYLGTLVRKKGVLDLSRIFSDLVETYPQARLRLVGRDSRDTKTGSASTWALCRQILSPTALERTEYLGPQPYDQVQHYLHTAAVCVFPSYAEALPLSWLEAMACARPIVAYNIGWAPELIEEGVSGRLVPLGNLTEFRNVLLDLLVDPIQQQHIGTAARQRIETTFTSDIVAQQSVTWYQQVLGGKR